MAIRGVNSLHGRYNISKEEATYCSSKSIWTILSQEFLGRNDKRIKGERDERHSCICCTHNIHSKKFVLIITKYEIEKTEIKIIKQLQIHSFIIITDLIRIENQSTTLTNIYNISHNSRSPDTKSSYQKYAINMKKLQNVNLGNKRKILIIIRRRCRQTKRKKNFHVSDKIERNKYYSRFALLW